MTRNMSGGYYTTLGNRWGWREWSVSRAGIIRTWLLRGMLGDGIRIKGDYQSGGHLLRLRSWKDDKLHRIIYPLEIFQKPSFFSKWAFYPPAWKTIKSRYYMQISPIKNNMLWPSLNSSSAGTISVCSQSYTAPGRQQVLCEQLLSNWKESIVNTSWTVSWTRITASHLTCLCLSHLLYKMRIFTILSNFLLEFLCQLNMVIPVKA
jgi:hypothetical protein